MVSWLPQANPKTGKRPKQAERITYPHNAEHNGEADGTDCGQEACSGLRKKKRTNPPPPPPTTTTPNQGGYRAGKSTWENAARFAFDVYEGFQRKEQTLAMAIDLEDAYNRVQFKVLMELLLQYGVSLMLTRWLAAALQERKVAMRLGN